MKYDIQFTNQFKKDLKLAQKQNKNLDKLVEVIDILANGGTLDAKYRDHDLTGNYKGTRECPKREIHRRGPGKALARANHRLGGPLHCGA